MSVTVTVTSVQSHHVHVVQIVISTDLPVPCLITIVDFCNFKISLLLIQEIYFKSIFSLDSSKAYREAPINTVDMGHIGHSIYQRGKGPK